MHSPDDLRLQVMPVVIGENKMTKYENRLINKHILVGLTYLNTDDTVKEKIQIHGVIKKITGNVLYFERSDNGEEFSIPFDDENIEEGQPGTV